MANTYLSDSAWLRLFTRHPDRPVFVQCYLTSGHYIDGQLFSFSRDSEESADREITLSGEIRYRESGASAIRTLPDGAATISARTIAVLLVSYLDETGPD